LVLNSERIKFENNLNLNKKTMAYLSKDQYSRRNENAAIRMQSNKSINSLTEEQHDALAFLCSARHNLHSQKDRAIESIENGLVQAIVFANVQIKESGLKAMSFVGTDVSDFIDIDTIDILDIDGDDEYDDEYNRISNDLEQLNDKIEKYLSEIDSKFGTNYAPTGLLRNF
jgi:hypothetical protein